MPKESATPQNQPYTGKGAPSSHYICKERAGPGLWLGPWDGKSPPGSDEGGLRIGTGELLENQARSFLGWEARDSGVPRGLVMWARLFKINSRELDMNLGGGMSNEEDAEQLHEDTGAGHRLREWARTGL